MWRHRFSSVVTMIGKSQDYLMPLLSSHQVSTTLRIYALPTFRLTCNLLFILKPEFCKSVVSFCCIKNTYIWFFSQREVSDVTFCLFLTRFVLVLNKSLLQFVFAVLCRYIFNINLLYHIHCYEIRRKMNECRSQSQSRTNEFPSDNDV